MTDIHHATPRQIAEHRAHVARRQRMNGSAIRSEPAPVPPPPKEVVMRPKPLWFRFADGCEQPERKITAADIKRAVADHFKVRVADIVSDRCDKAVVMPRHIGMYLTKQLTPLSYPQIGRQFGGRDHSTIIYAVNKIEALLLTDASLAAIVDAIRESIR